MTPAPVTTAEVVAQIREFAKNGPLPAPDHPVIEPLADLLNHYIDRKPTKIADDPTFRQLNGVKVAILTLLDDLPALIDGAKRSREAWDTGPPKFRDFVDEGGQPSRATSLAPDHKPEVLERLLSAAQAADAIWRRGPGVPVKDPLGWWIMAGSIAYLTSVVLNTAGPRKRKVGLNREGPIAKFVTWALDRVGESHSRDAVINALKSLPQRPLQM